MVDAQLQAAIELGNVKGVTKALRKGARVEATNESGVPMLHLAALLGSTAVVGSLLDHRACINAHSPMGAPLHAAVCAQQKYGEVAMVALLLTRQAQVNARDAHDLTPLHGAALRGQCQIISLLLDASAPLDVDDDSGALPIHAAAYAGKCEAVNLLVNRRARVDARYRRGPFAGFQAIHAVALKGHLEIATTLLDQRALCDARNDDDLQPIHIAAREGHCDVLCLLLDRGASETAHTRNGKSALDLARAEAGALLKDFQEQVGKKNEALQFKSRGNDMAAVELFGHVRCKLQSMKLPRRAAETAAQASACELAMGRFQECVQLCRAALEVRPPLPCQSIVKERMRNALSGIKTGHAAVDVDGETPTLGDQHQNHHDGLDAMRLAPLVPIATFDSDDRCGEHHSSNTSTALGNEGNQHILFPFSAESLPSEIVDDHLPHGPPSRPEAPSAVMTAGSTCSLEEQLASALARCKELEHRCESLTLERDEAVASSVRHQERAAQLECQLQELQASQVAVDHSMA